jgi:hypothetical protein
MLETLQENVGAAGAILDRVKVITISSHPASPIVHIYVEQIPPPYCPPSVVIVGRRVESPIFKFALDRNGEGYRL